MNPTIQNQVRDLLAEKKTLEKTLEITNQALESATRECELTEEFIEELEEEKNSKGDLIEALEMKVRDFEAATKHTEKLASENKS